MAITRQNTLPDPNHSIGTSGSTTATNTTAFLGAAPPGFKTLKIDSKAPIMKTRSNSGRMVARAIMGHTFTVNITYNPLTRAQFEPISSFLLDKRGGLKPFFLSLPQHRQSQAGGISSIKFTGDVNRLRQGNAYVISTVGGTTFTDLGAVTNTTGDIFTRSGATSVSGSGKAKAAAGSTSMVIDGFVNAASTTPQPGDMFTITDANDINHTKMYQITRVETPDAVANYDTFPHSSQSALAVTERVIHFNPGLQRAVSDNSDVIFNDPKMRVMLATDVQGYSLNVDNLYTFNLKLEEVQP